MPSSPASPKAPPIQPIGQRNPAWAEVAPLRLRRIALASWLAPGVSLLASIALNPAVKSGAVPPIAVAAINGVILATGLACGLWGLWSMRRFGPRGLLIPSICGTVLCGFLSVLLAAVLLNHVRGITPV